MRRGYVDTPEGQVHYQTEGTGEVIFMIHMAGSSSDQFAEVMPILGKSYRAVAMDVLGCGKSDLCPHSYRIEDYARNAIHVLDALCIKKAHVVGRATGSAIAVEMAAVYPQRVDKLILQLVDYAERQDQLARQEYWKNAGMKIKADGSHLIDWWNERMSRVYPDGCRHMTPEIAHRLLCAYLEADQGLSAEDKHRAAFAYNFDAKLPLIKSPTLLLWGVGDVRLDRMEPTRRMIPRCRTMVIPEAWVYAPWTKPAEVSQAIVDFINNPGV